MRCLGTMLANSKTQRQKKRLREWYYGASSISSTHTPLKAVSMDIEIKIETIASSLRKISERWAR
jgi:hypothetical protein